MTDPYKVLGVRPDASDDEIKEAYRALVRKYHPDKYADSDLSELATEKMKEINAAYEEIRSMRENGTGSASGGYSGQSPGGSGTGVYARVREAINRGDLDAAEVLLRAVAEEERGAQWHFLMGCVLLRRGQYVDAEAHLDHACRLDPFNIEYREVRNRLKNQTTMSGGYGSAGEISACPDGRCCSSLICADCCCECMGGDLIRCL